MLGQIFNAKELTQKLKATVQRTGKLGFTAETLVALNIRQGTHIRLAEDTESKRILWMGVLQEPAENAFPVNKAGDYYYVNTTKLFEKIGIDFKKKNCMYDMERAAEYDEHHQTLRKDRYRLQKEELHVRHGTCGRVR